MMTFKKTAQVFLILLCSVGTYNLYGQQITFNSSGEKIVQYTDGSWRYYNPSDSIYEVKPPAQNTIDAGVAEKERLRLEIEKERDRTQKAQAELNALQEQLRIAREERLKLEQQAKAQKEKDEREQAALLDELRKEQERKLKAENAEKQRQEQLANEQAELEEQLRKEQELKMKLAKAEQAQREKAEKEEKKRQENLIKQKLKREEQIRKDQERKLKEEQKEKERKIKEARKVLEAKLKLEHELRVKAEKAEKKRQEDILKEKKKLEDQLRKEEEDKLKREQKERDKKAKDERKALEAKLKLERDLLLNAENAEKKRQENILKERKELEDQLRKEQEDKLKQEQKERDKKAKDERKALEAKLKLERDLLLSAESAEKKRQENILKEKKELEDQLRKEQEAKLKIDQENASKTELETLELKLRQEQELRSKLEREEAARQEEAMKEKQRLENELGRESLLENDPSESNPSIPDVKMTSDTNRVLANNNLSQKLEAIEELRNNYALKAKFERDRYGNAQAKKIYVDQKLRRAKDNKDAVGEAEIKRLEEQLNQAKVDEKAAKKRSKQAGKKASKAIDVSHQSIPNQLAWFDKEMQDIEAQQAASESIASSESINFQTTVGSNDVQRSSRSAGTSARKKLASYTNPTVYPPKKECTAENSIDDFTGKKRRDTRLETFMEYTSDRMRPHLKGESYIKCLANLTTTSGYTFINMKFSIANEKANVAFGGLPKNSRVQFTFIDGNSLTLTKRRADDGVVDQLNKTTTYFIQLSIDKSSEKMLKSKLLDQIKIFWGKGFEEYDVTNLDFFHSHIKCLRDD